MAGFYDLEASMRYHERHFGDGSPFIKYLRPSWEILWKTFPYKLRSPVRFVDRIECPVLLIHGTADEYVPPDESRGMNDALIATGKESRLVLIPDLGHGYDEQSLAGDALWRESIAFLRRHLCE